MCRPAPPCRHACSPLTACLQRTRSAPPRHRPTRALRSMSGERAVSAESAAGSPPSRWSASRWQRSRGGFRASAGRAAERSRPELRARTRSPAFAPDLSHRWPVVARRASRYRRTGAAHLRSTSARGDGQDVTSERPRRTSSGLFPERNSSRSSRPSPRGPPDQIGGACPQRRTYANLWVAPRWVAPRGAWHRRNSPS